MARSPTRPVGQRGEEIAARFLVRRGYRLVERNHRTRFGEIDIVAKDGETLVFVEVKARQETASAPPQVGVSLRKRVRLARLARGYLAYRGLAEGKCRFDVVAVTLGPPGAAPRVDHFRGAFLADGWIL